MQAPTPGQLSIQPAGVRNALTRNFSSPDVAGWSSWLSKPAAVGATKPRISFDCLPSPKPDKHQHSSNPSWQPSFPDGQPCSATRPCSLLQHPSWTKTCPPTAMLMATHHPSANSSRKPRHHPPATAAYPHPNCGLWIEHIWRLASIKTVSRPKSTVRGTHWTSRRKSVCGRKTKFSCHRTFVRPTRAIFAEGRVSMDRAWLLLPPKDGIFTRT